MRRVYMSVPISFDAYGNDAYMVVLHNHGSKAAEEYVLLETLKPLAVMTLVEQGQIEWEMTQFHNCIRFPHISDEDLVALKLAATDEEFFGEELVAPALVAPRRATPAQ